MQASDCEGNTSFRIGAGIYDITGPAGEREMMGYVMLTPPVTTGGIHTRLRARAFVVESPCNGKRFAFVSVDLCYVSQAVHQEVLERLNSAHGGLYTAENVVLSATHTHSGPGGYSHYMLYTLISLGFDKQNFDVIVDGICAAVRRAHDNLEPGSIRIAADDLHGVSRNRSLEAYALNPDKSPHEDDDTDKRMTLLRLTGESADVGSINWFAVHGTSMGNHNHLISGDNKGYASYLFEREMGANYAADKTFVAAFAQANEGDVSPNVAQTKDGRTGDDFASMAASGEAQYRKAMDLFEGATELITGGVEYSQAYFKFSKVELSPEWVQPDLPARTGPSAIGLSKLAGTDDGRGVFFIKQGLHRQDLGPIRSTFVHAVVHVLFRTRLLFSPMPKGRNRRRLGRSLPWRFGHRNPQDPKPVFIPLGEMDPPWTPQVLPLQIVRLGQLAIIAVPFECTTTAGRRIRATVEECLRPAGVTYSVIAGLSNAYAGYCTTPEEYGRQNYEGASTEFGRAQLPALQQSLSQLAEELLGVREPVADASVPDVPPDDLDLNISLWLDLGTFGKVKRQPKASYHPGEVVKVSFRSGHPNNNPHTQSSFVEVQHLRDGSWEPVAHDWEPETRYFWGRLFISPWSRSTVEWHIPDTAEPGTYRIFHRGYAKPWRKQPQPYEGMTRAFQVG